MKCKDIKSSDFKRKIKVQNIEIRKNKDKIPVKTLISEVERKAILFTGGSLTLKRQEFLQSLGYNVKKHFEFVIRFTNISTNSIIVFKDKEYEIKAIENVEEKDRYLLLLTERVE